MLEEYETNVNRLILLFFYLFYHISLVLFSNAFRFID